MDQRTAPAGNRTAYQTKTVSFSEIPGQSGLFRDFQNDSGKILDFYPTKGRELHDLAESVLAGYETDRQRLCRALRTQNESYGAGPETFENLERLGRGNCVAVLTGQQAGLFSGAGYTVYKALSAVRLAGELTRTGTDAVPVFWIASEDHDFEEISRTFFIDSKQRLAEVRSRPADDPGDTPVGFLPIGDDIGRTIDSFIEQQTRTAFTDRVRELLTDSYRPGENYADAFGRLLAKIFDGHGIVFVSPLDPELRRLSSGIYLRALENRDLIVERLLERNEELVDKGYHRQVLVEEDHFPFFYIDENKRRLALRSDPGSETVRTVGGEHRFALADLRAIAGDAPEKLSPNALLRPVVQDHLFPTVCYFGGGAEIAYFGQNSVIYETLGRTVTPIRHRSSFTLVPGRNRRFLEKYDLGFRDLFEGEEQVRARIVERFLHPEIARGFEETGRIIGERLDELDGLLEQADPTLSDHLGTRRRKMDWHLQTLRKKFRRSAALRNETVERQVGSLFTNLLPEGALQERSINTLCFLNLYGENLIDWLHAAADPEETAHQLVIF